MPVKMKEGLISRFEVLLQLFPFLLREYANENEEKVSSLSLKFFDYFLFSLHAYASENEAERLYIFPYA